MQNRLGPRLSVFPAARDVLWANHLSSEGGLMRTLTILLAGFAAVLIGFLPPCLAATPTTTPSQTTIAVFQLEGPVTEAPTEELELFGPKYSTLRELLKPMN